MIIREVVLDDLNDILEWRNNKSTRKMSFNSGYINKDEHIKWFNKSLKNKNKFLFLGLKQNKKIGICSFDINLKQNKCEVSINLNPTYRNQGFSKILLKNSIKKIRNKYKGPIIANIKINNLKSISIFEKNGFNLVRSFNNKNTYRLEKMSIKFDLVKGSKSQILELFNLLKIRKYNISNTSKTNFKDHSYFVKNNPYKYWYIIYEKDNILGSFYIHRNNSVGINLVKSSSKITKLIINFIKDSHKPMKAVKSIVPNYFYVNVPYKNKYMINILKKNGLKKIQETFVINE